MKPWRTVQLVLAAALAIITVTADCAAQLARPEGFTWGIWADGGAILAKAAFASLPQVASCARPETRVDGGSGWSFGGGIEAGWPREFAFGNGRWGGAVVRIGLQRSSIDFEPREQSGTVTDASGSLLPLIVVYETGVVQTELRIEPTFVYRPFGGAPVELALGFAVFAPLSGRFDYRERIAEPAAAEFAGGAKEWNAQAGTLSGAGVHESLVLGLSVGLDLTPTLVLYPKLSGALALNAPLRDASWLPHTLRLGFSLNWRRPIESTPIEEG